MAQNNQASVEEILDSIKRVIARDNRDSALEARRQREEQAECAEQGASDTRGGAHDAEEVLDLSEMVLHESSEADAEHDSFETDDSEEDDTPLIRDAARGAVQENLAALAMLSEPSARPQIVRSGETSLEGLTRELLRPMLAEWLDKNLPGMVEKLVQAEIARIARKKS